MSQEIDPPTFDFDRRGGRGREDAPPEPEEVIEAFPDQAGSGEAEPPVGEGAEPGDPRRSRFRLVRSETGRRVLWAIPWVIFAIAIVVIGGLAFTATMIALGVIGLRELFRMAERLRPFLLPAFAVLAAMVLTAHYGRPFHILLAFACLFPLLFLFAASRENRDAVTVSLAITVFGVAWMGTAFAHAVLLRDLPDHGAALLVDVLVATFVGDTCAYGGGRLFGSRKITPQISPNKTLEGLVAGFIGGTLGFWFAGTYQDWLPGWDALVMGMAVAAIAPVGDLFASMIKRDLEVKDTGTLFGPHGGLIDRLDAVLFTVVVGYYVSVAFVY
jgi:phosphatidate cytidylyltransferase